MLGRQNPDPDPGSEETAGSVRQILLGVRDYLAARAELLGLESREAAAVARAKFLAAVVLLLCAFFGYALVLVVLVQLLALLLAALLPAGWAPHAWLFSAALLGALNLGVAFAAWLRLRRPPPTPLFETSRAEFEKDREWLKDQ